MLDCVCDYDPPEFYSCHVRRARKQHRCEECSGTILPGETYEVVVAKWDGFFGQFKTCERCCDIRQWVQNNVPCLCWAHGNMIEDCREAVQEAALRAPDETLGLRFGLKRRVHERDNFNQVRRAAEGKVSHFERPRFPPSAGA